MKEEKIFKSGFVTMIGKTNVGKSSIMNAIIGEKIAAIANKPQTTRTAIKGILNTDHSQVVFVDTPGIHKAQSKLGSTMNDTAIGSIPDVDIVIYVIEATDRKIDEKNRMILDKITESKKKTILVINKIDLVQKEKILELINLYKNEYEFLSIIPVSVNKNKNIVDLIKEIESNLKEGPAYYNIDEYTDQTLRDLVNETVREKTLRFLNEEVPHGILVETDEMKIKKSQHDEKVYHIESTIYVLRESHKGIVIGKSGSMLKRIGSSARIELEKILDMKVNLKLWVKVKQDWINDERIIKKFKIDS